MTISYFISVPSFKSTAFVVWILARGEGVNSPPPLCFKATSEPPCTIGLILITHLWLICIQDKTYNMCIYHCEVLRQDYQQDLIMAMTKTWSYQQNLFYMWFFYHFQILYWYWKSFIFFCIFFFCTLKSSATIIL